MRTSLVTSHCAARYATRTSLTLANFVNSGRANENRSHTDTPPTPRKRPRGDVEPQLQGPSRIYCRRRSAGAQCLSSVLGTTSSSSSS